MNISDFGIDQKKILSFAAAHLGISIIYTNIVLFHALDYFSAQKDFTHKISDKSKWLICS